MRPDSTWLTNANLPKNKPVVLIYFSPECGHCQLAAQEISNSYDQLKEATFLWVSYYSVPEIGTFVKKYKLEQYKNFLFGRDPRYFLPSFFKVRFTPFMAVYDNNGQFVQAFEQGANPETLATLIHQNLNNKKKG
jgi:thiol-disulfide isomerase/thioredoxin